MMSRMFFLFFSMHVVKKLGGKKYGKTSTSSKERAKNDRFFPLHSNDNCRRRSSFCMHMEWNNLRQTHKKADERKIKNLNFILVLLIADFFGLQLNPLLAQLTDKMAILGDE